MAVLPVSYIPNEVEGVSAHFIRSLFRSFGRQKGVSGARAGSSVVALNPYAIQAELVIRVIAYHGRRW